MPAFQAIQAIAGTLYMLTMGLVGCRLLYVSTRTRRRPELYLGASLLIGGVMAAGLEAAGLAGARDLEPRVVGRLLLLGKTFGVLGVLFQVLFIHHVFRPGERWATALATLLVAWPTLCILGMAAGGAFATGHAPHAWVLLEFTGRLAGPVWLVAEGTRYHHMMRRRLALGLADPVVTDRFRLWAMAGACAAVFLTTSLPPIFLDPVHNESLLAVDLLLFAAAGIGACVLYWLAFFPPTAYRRRVARLARVHA